MSRGFKGWGFNRKLSNIKDLTNFIQSVAGDGDAAVDKFPDYLTNQRFDQSTNMMGVPFLCTYFSLGPRSLKKEG